VLLAGFPWSKISNFIDVIFVVAVAAIGVWLLFGSSPQSRSPDTEPRARFFPERARLGLRRRRG
jgi:hypothetical protein